MKSIIKYISLSLVIGAFSSCSDFEDINNDPTKANEDQVKVEYFINKSIIAAQQDPYYGERVFVLTWKSLARQHSTTGAALGNFDDEYTGAYFSANAEWQNAAQTAINLADTKMENGSLNPNDQIFVPQAKQAARIWKAYLMAEFIDMYGVTSIDAFKGYNPQYNSAKEGYIHIFKELTEAVAELEALPKGGKNAMNEKLDAAYGFDFTKWIQYANSLRMRYAMRISKVEPQLAREQFEAAIKSDKFIKTADDNFWVQEKGGWSDLSGVMSRGWNAQLLSTTINNMYLGLGGVETSKLVADSLRQYIKPANYLGLKLENHYTKYSNNPSNGFWLDGLPNTIDPRAIKTFYIPGEYSNSNNRYQYSASMRQHKQDLLDPANDTKVLKTIDAKFTWNGGRSIGAHGTPGALNKVESNVGTTPGMVIKYRDESQKRIFFPSWESYFLLAEAALEWGGSFGGYTAEAAYNEAIKQNFEYNGVAEFVDEYLASESYNRVGTSVKWSHTAEPSATVQMDYVNGYTGVAGTYTYKYPEASKTLYGKALNDKYVKLYTQKYLANMPYMPMEAWSDQRKMGLPFFETPAAEQAISTIPTLSQTTVFEKQLSTFFPQRSQFPSKFRNSSAEGYKQAVGLLNGEDKVYTKIWWANY